MAGGRGGLEHGLKRGEAARPAWSRRSMTSRERSARRTSSCAPSSAAGQGAWGFADLETLRVEHGLPVSRFCRARRAARQDLLRPVVPATMSATRFAVRGRRRRATRSGPSSSSSRWDHPVVEQRDPRTGGLRSAFRGTRGPADSWARARANTGGRVIRQLRATVGCGWPIASARDSSPLRRAGCSRSTVRYRRLCCPLGGAGCCLWPTGKA